MSDLIVLFFVKKDRIDQDGKVPIHCKIKTSHSLTSFATGETVDFKRWTLTKRLKDSRLPDEKSIRLRLSELEKRLKKDWSVWQQSTPSLNVKEFKEHINRLSGDWNLTPGHEDESDSLRHLFDLHLSRVQMKVDTGENSPATYEKVERCLRHTMEMVKDVYGLDDYRLSKLRLEFIEKLFHYFRTQRKQDHNSAVKHVEFFRAAIGTGISNDLLDKDPFMAYKKRKRDIQRNFLDDDQIRRIVDYDFNSSRLDLVRDLFVIGIFTGYSYIDIVQLGLEHMKEKDNGKMYLMKKRTKTQNSVAAPCEVPLLPPVERLINKYRNDPRCKSGKRLFPSLTNQTLNAYLKEIQDLCQIPFNLHFHLSRHTFSTTITLAKGVSIEVVARMLGHKRLTSTQHYARLVEQRVINETERLYDLYK
jgi:integrase